MNTRKPRLCCDFCSKRCSSETSLRVHKRSVHLNEGILCPYCSVILPSSVLAQHVASCKAVDINTTDSLLHCGRLGVEENYLDDLPSRLSSVRTVAVDWDSLLARSLPEQSVTIDEPVMADRFPVACVSDDDDDYAEPLDDGSERVEETPHTSPMSEVENLSVAPKPMTKSRRASSNSALQRMRSVNQLLRTLFSETSDATPKAAEPPPRPKRGPEKTITGRPRKKKRLSKPYVPSDHSNDDTESEVIDVDSKIISSPMAERNCEEDKCADQNDEDEQTIEPLSNDETGNLVINLDEERESSSVKKKKLRGQKAEKKKAALRLIQEMNQLVAVSHNEIVQKQRLKVKASTPIVPKVKQVDLDSSEEEVEVKKGGRKSKNLARQKIKSLTNENNNPPISDISSEENTNEVGTSKVRTKKKQGSKRFENKSNTDDKDKSDLFQISSDDSSESYKPNHNENASDTSISDSESLVQNDEYDSDVDFDEDQQDGRAMQKVIPCPSTSSTSDRDAMVISSPFVSLFISFFIDPHGAHVIPSLPIHSFLPAVNFENDDDCMKSGFCVCENCGLVRKSQTDKNIHAKVIHKSSNTECPYCKALIPITLYATHTWLLCPKIQRLYPRSLFSTANGPTSFRCNICDTTIYTTVCPFVYLWHVIHFHSKFVNAQAVELLECSRCQGCFHKAFFSIHDYLCKIASEMSVSLANLASYHVNFTTAFKLGRPVPSYNAKVVQIRDQVMIIGPNSSSPILRSSLLATSRATSNVTGAKPQHQTTSPRNTLKSNPKPQHQTGVSHSLSKPNPVMSDEVVELVNIPSSPEDPTQKTTKTVSKVASKQKEKNTKPHYQTGVSHSLPKPNPVVTNEVVELVNIPSSPEDSTQKTTKTVSKVAPKQKKKKRKRQNKQDDFSSIFLDNIFEPSSPPSSPISDDNSFVYGSSKDDTLDSSRCDDSKNDNVSEQKQQKQSVIISEQVNGGTEASEKVENENDLVITNVEEVLKKNICEFCGKGVDLASEFQSHKQEHKGGVRCPLCLALLPRCLLLCHRRLFCTTLHKNVTWYLQCSLCKKEIPSPFHLLRHALDWHSNHVTRKRGSKSVADEPTRQRCDHCAAPVRPIFFECHQEMCFRKLQFEMKTRPLVKKVSYPDSEEPPDKSNDCVAKESVNIDDDTVPGNKNGIPDSLDSVGVAEASECAATPPATPQRVEDDLDKIPEAQCDFVPVSIDALEAPDLADDSNPVEPSVSIDMAPIAVSNGFEAGLSTPTHLASEDDAVHDAMDCDLNLFMENSMTPIQNFSSDSLRMSSSLEKGHDSLERGNDELVPTLSATDNSATLFEDINEVLEAVMHEDGQES